MGIQRVRGKGGTVGTRYKMLHINIPATAYRAKMQEEPLIDSWTGFPFINILSEVTSLFQTGNNQCRVKNKGKQKLISTVYQECHQNEEEIHECTHIIFFRLKSLCPNKYKAYLIFVSPVYFCCVEHWCYFLSREFSGKPPTSWQISYSQLLFLFIGQSLQAGEL